MHMEHEQHKAQLDLDKKELAKKYNGLEAKYEEKRLALLVAEVKLMFDQGSAEAPLPKIRKELATMQYKVSMGEEKVCLLLSSHKAQTQRIVINSLEKC